MRECPGRRWALAFAFWIAVTLPAVAECVGRDLTEVYRSEDPGGVEQMFAAARAVPNAQGRFWEVQRGDGPVSHLFGTFHAGSAVETVPTAVWEKAENARVAVFELDLSERDRLARDPSLFLDFDIPPLSERLPPGTRDSVDAALRARGHTLQTAAQMRPWLLVALLGLPPCQLQAAAEGDEALDMVLAGRAASAGVPLAGLETFEEQIAPLEEMDSDLLFNEIAATAENADMAPDIFITHLALYSAGEIQAIQEFSVWLAERHDPEGDARESSEAFLNALLEGRNLEWMPGLIEHLEAGPAFVAVGALHLPGETGLVELLRAEGFRVTRLD